MRSQKIYFQNSEGVKLSAKLELPSHRKPYTCAIFAHCFTCNKNLTAVKNIAKALTQNGVAVLRFDFTGLGESEGEFAHTSFSSNVSDLCAAADFLTTHYEQPSMLIGHSLGGAAVIAAASEITSIKAVATIGAPFDPSHVIHHFEEKVPEIEKQGVAEVHIGGRPFQLGKNFLEDIRENNLKSILNNFGKALLIMHAPEDDIVDIDNAANIYQYARHPKSFISLDGANHLLSNKEDSIYVGAVIAAWMQKYVPDQQIHDLEQEKTVTVQLNSIDGFTAVAKVRHHQLVADEPTSVGGNDFGPNPYEYVAIGLGSCTVMTLHMYARRKKWDLESATVDLDHLKEHAPDCEEPENEKKKVDVFHRKIRITGQLTEAQVKRLQEIADKCPVHKTLESSSTIRTELTYEA